MKSLKFTLVAGVMFAMSLATVGLEVSADVTHKRKSVLSKTVKKTAPKEDLQTEVRFDDSVLHGQYQTPDEALAKVENEKGLQDLIGVRKHFKDRLSVANEQE